MRGVWIINKKIINQQSRVFYATSSHHLAHDFASSQGFFLIRDLNYIWIHIQRRMNICMTSRDRPVEQRIPDDWHTGGETSRRPMYAAALAAHLPQN